MELSPTHGRFVVVGDLQRTSLLELLRERNLSERRALIDAVARERADFVVLLGDLVFLGDSEDDWRDFDRLVANVRAPLLPVLGNHDYGVFPRRALAKLHARFPHLGGARFYERRYRDLSLLFLDSNRTRMGRAAWEAQLSWYRAALARGVARAVLVFVHHPPFTNSSVTGDDRDVREHLVPPFLASRRTVAMISGHVHSYERFERSGKLFIVAGGGGGPRPPLREGARRRHDDDRVSLPPLRPFHYLRIDHAGDRLVIDVEGLHKGTTAVTPLDSLTVPLP